MNFEILNEKGDVVNTIVADRAFCEKVYSGKYREVAEPNSTQAEQDAQDAKQKILALEIPSGIVRALREHLIKVRTTVYLADLDAQIVKLRKAL